MRSTASRSARVDFEFRDYLAVLHRRRWWVVGIALLTVLGGLALSLSRPKQYQATGSVLVEIDQPDPVKIQTEHQLFTSDVVKQRAHAILADADDASPDAATTSQVMNVSATSKNAQHASDSVNAFMNAYLAYKLDRAKSDADAQVQRLQSAVDSENNLLTSLDAQAISGATNPDLDRQRAAALSQLPLLQQQLTDAQTASASVGPGAAVITPASAPSSPSSPKPVRDGLLALLVGLVLGLGAAFLVEYFNDSIHDRDDVVRTVGDDAPVLSVIPTGPRRRSGKVIAALSDPSSGLAESYRSLRTALQFAGFERPIRSIEFTSPDPGAGSSTVVANLAVLLARAGQRVVVVDADLHDPSMHDLFGMPNEHGLTDLMLGASIDEVVRPVPGVDLLSIVTAGELPPQPAELLASRRWADVLSALTRDAVVLVDTPALLPFTDATVIAATVDALVVVAAAGQTSRRELRTAVEILSQIEAPLIGVTLNRVSPDALLSYDSTGKGRRGGRRERRARRKSAARRAAAAKAPRATGEVEVAQAEHDVVVTGPSQPTREV